MKSKTRLHRFWLFTTDTLFLPRFLWRPLCWRRGHVDDAYSRCVICGLDLRRLR